MKICIQCGSSILGRGLKFCGNSCKTTYSNLRNNPAKLPSVKRKLSKIAIQNNYQKKMMSPAARKKAVKGISKALKGKPHSVEWRNAIGRGVRRAGCRPPNNSKNLVGPKHPNWRGGYSTVRNQDFKNPLYVAFRNTVLRRDDYRCRRCNTHGGKLQAHHIKPWGEYPKLRYEPSNGLTLCFGCHKLEHKGVPRPLTAGPRTLAALYSSPA